jgi:hypothetical protein
MIITYSKHLSAVLQITEGNFEKVFLCVLVCLSPNKKV